MLQQTETEPKFEQPKLADDSDWNWQHVSEDAIDPDDFLFNGRVLKLNKENTEKIQVQAMVVEEFCQFGQWHFGESSSTRVAVVAEMDGDQINRIFVDRNRDRVVDDGEEVKLLESTTPGQKVWLANLNVEVREGDDLIHAQRQIVITLRRKKNEIRISTIGQAEGTVEIDGKQIVVRRVDRDGNGLPNDSADQIWFDLDQDGEFDQISERFNMQSALEIGGTRFAMRSDRLGHKVLLTADNDRGSIQFIFTPKQASAKVVMLEGALRDESGMLIAIRPSDEPVSVPVGKYCIENLVVELEDESGANWRMTLFRRMDAGWFQVEKDQQHDLRLLDSIEFRGTAQAHAEDYRGYLNSVEPMMYTNNGLSVTDFTCRKPGEKKDAFRTDPATATTIKIKQAGMPDAQPKVHCSGFS